MANGFEDWINPPNGGNANNVNPQPIGWQQPGGLGFFLNAMNSYNKVDPNSRYMNISYGGDPGSVLGIAIKLLNARNKFKAENNTLKNYLDALDEMTARNKQNRLGMLGINTGYGMKGGGGQGGQKQITMKGTGATSGGGQDDRPGYTEAGRQALASAKEGGGESKPNPWASKGNVGYTVEPWGGGDSHDPRGLEKYKDVPGISGGDYGGGNPSQPPTVGEVTTLAKELGLEDNPDLSAESSSGDDSEGFEFDEESGTFKKKKKKSSGGGGTGVSLSSVSGSP